MIYTIDYFLLAFIFYGFVKASDTNKELDTHLNWALMWPILFLCIILVSIIDIFAKREMAIIDFVKHGWKLKN